MKAISTGNVYRIYDNTLRTYDQLPAQSYVVRCDMQTGFFLEKYVDIEITEEKVYGVHTEKVEKVLHSFGKINRSLGVILSGDKGIGKSLFAKMLSIAAMKNGMPLIVVDQYFQGIASYLESIEQEVMVLFDEFDKTFGEVRARDGEATPQTALLSLFDGVSGGKKLYVITCNELRKLNEFLVNRPGRFHYHFRFDYPSADEVRQYMLDKLPAEMYGQIDDVVAFSAKVNLNYDCLRAIAFEIACGLTFKEAIVDLNIINMDAECFDLTLFFNNGSRYTEKEREIDLYGSDEEVVRFYNKSSDMVARINFDPGDCIYDPQTGLNIVHADNLTVEYYPDEDDPEDIKAARQSGVSHMVIKRHAQRNLHYAV